MNMSEIPSTLSGHCNLKYMKKKGGLVLLRGGHQYYARRKHNSGLTVWACTQRRLCKGILRIKDERILEESAHHASCQPDFAKNLIAESVEALKKDIVTPDFPSIPTTYNKMVGNLKDSGLDLITKIPQFETIKNSLYRERNTKAQVSKLNYTNVSEVEVPIDFKDFVLADYSFEKTRILLFSASTMRDKMTKFTDFYGDGTFKSCPIPFSEIYSIHGDAGSNADHTHIMPLVYALLSDRNTSTYITLFKLIKSQIPDWNPLTFRVDYEKAVMKAISIVFPSTIIKGCYFHFNKAIFHYGKNTDEHNPKSKRMVELSAVLPLLPEEKIMEGWAYIYKQYGMYNTDKQIKNFVSYMEKQWLDEDFIKVWCVFGDSHRTINSLESWHNKLNKAVGKKGPALIQLLHVLKEDSSLFTVQYIRKTHEVASKRKRARKSRLNDDFIRETQLQLIEGSMTVGHFLEILRH